LKPNPASIRGVPILRGFPIFEQESWISNWPTTGFLGIELNESRNAETAGMISADASRVAVRVIRTDEDLMIALIEGH
jgi:Acetokinase family